MHAELKNMQQLFPEGRGRLLAFNVEKDVDDLAAQFRKVRVLVDSDFAAAMKSMDQDIPPKIRQVEADADALKEFGYQYSGAQASATFASFGSIKHTAVIFGIANSVIAFCAFMFVLLAARRSRGQLSETLARLDERTQELQQTNGALETEVDKYQRTEKMLRESEERFSSAFELAPIGMALVAPEGRWLKVNRAICELVGYAEAELLAHTFQEITHPADLAADLDCVRRLLAGEIRFYQMEKRYIHARGHFVTVLLDVSLVHDTQGQPLYFIAQIQDITERKRAASALLESQRFLRATLDALTSHIAILDERGTIIEVNAAWNRFAGENNFPASDDVGNNYLKVCDSAADNFSKEAPTVGDGIRAVIAGQQKEFQLEYPCHSPHEKGWFLVRVTRFGGDGPVRVVVAHENITERKQAEEDLRWKTAFLEAQVNSSIDGILVVDPQSRKLLQNQRFNDLFKLPRHIVDDQDDEKQFRWIKDMMKNSEQFVEKVVYLYASPDKISRDEIEMKDGTILDRYSSPVTGKDGRHYGRIWTFRDITDRKKLESQLIQSQKMETVGKLAGGVAHEFNSILTAIIMQSELLLADLPADSPLAENATEITKAANRAATLTRQLLAYGRKQFLQPKTLDLNLLVTEMEDTLRHLLGRDVDVRVSVAGFKMVLVDAGQIEQVIMNLAMNARDAMPKGGKLTLETAEVSFDAESVGRSPELKPGEYVMLAMTDNGTGMSAEVKTRLFEPFFTTKDIGQGTGLGLSTCYGIIKQSGGHISVYSELGRGTTFKIYLPQVETPAKLPVPQLEAPDLPRGTETILLVEDDPALREMAAMLLRRLGYTVLAKANGIEALSLETQRAGGRVDLLLTDVVMPHMSGRELADRVRALYPHTKILFTSAYTENAIVHQDTLDKGVALLQKPFTPSALANKLRAVLDAPAA
jgi:PAS domain S-box-containing protein